MAVMQRSATAAAISDTATAERVTLDPENARHVAACHECGHAIAALVLGYVVRAVTVNPDGTGLARVAYPPDASAEDRATVDASGPAAVWLLLGIEDERAGGDRRNAVERVGEAGIGAAWLRGLALARAYAERIEKLARLLLERGELSSADMTVLRFPGERT